MRTFFLKAAELNKSFSKGLKFLKFSNKIFLRHIFVSKSRKTSNLFFPNMNNDCRIDTTVYVISRINNLLYEMKDIIQKNNANINVMEITLPKNSDILPPEDVEKLVNINVIVADSSILALNYKCFPSLKLAYLTWAGVEILYEHIHEKPPFLIVRHGGTAFCDQMAEYVMAQVLNYERHFNSIWKGQQEKSWSNMLLYMGTYRGDRLLRELNIGILGIGNMGQAVAKYFKAHGTKLIGFSRRPREPSEFGYFDRVVVNLNDVLQGVDYIVNTLPSTRDTRGLLNGEVLKICEKKPVFINVGRASIINEEDLLNALSHEWLSHAILDVFENEPLRADSLLWDKVTVTPHIAAISRPHNIAKDFLLTIESFAQSKPLANLLQWEAGY